MTTNLSPTQNQSPVQVALDIGVPWVVRGKELVRVSLTITPEEGEPNVIEETVFKRTAMRALRMVEAGLIPAPTQVA